MPLLRFFIACERGHFNIVKYLLKNPTSFERRFLSRQVADINALSTIYSADRRKKKLTPLDAACNNNHLNIVEYLLSNELIRETLPAGLMTNNGIDLVDSLV
jgi:ankyrin repeat protein